MNSNMKETSDQDMIETIKALTNKNSNLDYTKSKTFST